MTPASTKDFHLTNHLSFYTLLPLSEPAKDWVNEHLPEDRQTLGNQIFIEAQYVGDVVHGINEAGLSLN